VVQPEPAHRRVPLSPDAYDWRWDDLAAGGAEVHGEAALVDALVASPGARILDAGCGTGRVALELTRRQYVTVGIDVDPALLDRARSKAPNLEWGEADLARLEPDVAPGPFAAVVLAGNVMIFVARGTEASVLDNLAGRLAPDGVLVSGFQLSGRLSVDQYDAHAAAAGLRIVDRWSTWDRAPFTDTSDYVVSVHTPVSKR